MILCILPCIVDFNALCQNYNTKRGGVTVVVFKISELENVIFASFKTRRYDGVILKAAGRHNCLEFSSAMIITVGKGQVKADEVHNLFPSLHKPS